MKKLYLIFFISIFFIFSLNIFGKKITQRTCGLGSGGSITSSNNLQYQQISNINPFKIQILSKKTLDSDKMPVQNFDRTIYLELTSFPMDYSTGSQFSIIAVENLEN